MLACFQLAIVALMPCVDAQELTVYDEKPDDSTIGSEWSPSRVTKYPDYGYIHGACSACGSGKYGFLTGALERTFLTPAQHSLVRIKMRLWQFDSWNEEYLRVTVDGVQYFAEGLREGSCNAGWTSWASGSSYSATKSCWSNDVQLFIHTCYRDIEIQVAHSAPSVSVRVEADLDQGCSDESYGVSEVQVVTILDQEPVWLIVYNENADESTIGSEWSPASVTNYPDYGYIHGACLACGSGKYGFLTGALERTFSTPAQHSLVLIKMRLWQFDSWNEEYLRVMVDGVQYFAEGLRAWSCNAGWTSWASGSSYSATKSCWSNSFQHSINTCYRDIEIQVAHSSPSVTVRVEADLDQGCNDESYGVSEVQISIDQATTTTNTTTSSNRTSVDIITSVSSNASATNANNPSLDVLARTRINASTDVNITSNVMTTTTTSNTTVTRASSTSAGTILRTTSNTSTLMGGSSRPVGMLTRTTTNESATRYVTTNDATLAITTKISTSRNVTSPLSSATTKSNANTTTINSLSSAMSFEVQSTVAAKMSTSAAHTTSISTKVDCILATSTTAPMTISKPTVLSTIRPTTLSTSDTTTTTAATIHMSSTITANISMAANFTKLLNPQSPGVALSVEASSFTIAQNVSNEWGPCSSSCGPGERKRHVYCSGQSGLCLETESCETFNGCSFTVTCPFGKAHAVACEIQFASILGCISFSICCYIGCLFRWLHRKRHASAKARNSEDDLDEQDMKGWVLFPGSTCDKDRRWSGTSNMSRFCSASTISTMLESSSASRDLSFRSCGSCDTSIALSEGMGEYIPDDILTAGRADDGRIHVIWYTKNQKMQPDLFDHLRPALETVVNEECQQPQSTSSFSDLSSLTFDIVDALTASRTGCDDLFVPLTESDHEAFAESDGELGDSPEGLLVVGDDAENYVASRIVRTSSPCDATFDHDVSCLQSLTPKVYTFVDDKARMEYLSANNKSWLPATMQVEISHRARAMYHARSRKQYRYNVPFECLRRPFEQGELVEVFSGKNGGSWEPALVDGTQVSSATQIRYEVRLESASESMSCIPAERLRHRYLPGHHVSVYKGLAEGWVSGIVGEYAADDDAESPCSSLRVNVKVHVAQDEYHDSPPKISRQFCDDVDVTQGSESLDSKVALRQCAVEADIDRSRRWIDAFNAEPEDPPEDICMDVDPWVKVPVICDGSSVEMFPSYLLRQKFKLL